MGLRGPVGDPDSTRAPSVKPVLLRKAPIAFPRALEEWDEAVQVAWHVYTTSQVALAVEDVDVFALRRLFTYYDTWVRTAVEWQSSQDRRVTMLGQSGGQLPALKVSAYLEQMARLEQLMEKLEQRFGISPAMRARLGITVAEAITASRRATEPQRRNRGRGRGEVREPQAGDGAHGDGAGDGGAPRQH